MWTREKVLLMKIFGYSKALYSTWLYLEPLRLLFDAGEGLNSFLEGRLLAFRNIAITHAHTDHFTGLQNIFITRLREMEVTKQPLPPIKLFYPEDSHTLRHYFDYLEKVTNRWDELVQLQPVRPGQTYPLEGVRGVYLNVLKADHYVYQQTAVCYRLDQERFSLKPELQELLQAEINKRIANEGRDALTTRVLRPLIFYSGDGRAIGDKDSQDVPLMIHEATFLEPSPKVAHASLPEVIKLYRETNAKHLLLFHLSTRYEYKEFIQLLDKLVPEQKERSRVFVIRPGGMFAKNIPVPGF